MLNLVRLALRSLVQARRRTLLLGTAIALVAALLVLLQSISAGIRENLVRCATTIAAGHVVVGGFTKVSPGTVAPVIHDASKIRGIVADNTPGLDYIVDRSRGLARLVSPLGALESGLVGINLENEPRFVDSLALEEGDLSRLAELDGAVLFASQAKRLRVRVGDAVTLQTEIGGGHTNTADVTIVAIVRDVGLLSTFNVFVNQELIRNLYQLNSDTTGAIWVYLKDIEEAGAVMKHLRGVLSAAGYTLLQHEAAPFFFKFESAASQEWVGMRLDVTTWEDEVSFLTWVVRAFDGLTGYLKGVLFFVIGIGIMNATWTSVRERTREIGTMRAIGMQRSQVLALFMLEAALLGLCAATTGALLGAALSLALDAAHMPAPDKAMETILLSDTLAFTLRPQALLRAVFALTLLTTLSAIWPALRAGSLRPIVALGHVE